jgi:hypothetical protein
MPKKSADQRVAAIQSRPEAERRRFAYADAERQLREAHREEFEGMYAAACLRYRVPYQRKLTAAEKEAETVRAILGRRPDLHQSVLDQLEEYDRDAEGEAANIRAAAERGEEV